MILHRFPYFIASFWLHLKHAYVQVRWLVTGSSVLCTVWCSIWRIHSHSGTTGSAYMWRHRVSASGKNWYFLLFVGFGLFLCQILRSTASWHIVWRKNSHPPRHQPSLCCHPWTLRNVYIVCSLFLLCIFLYARLKMECIMSAGLL